MDRNAGVSGLAAPRAAPSPLVKGLAAEKENTPVKPPNPGRRSSIGGKTPGRTPTSILRKRPALAPLSAEGKKKRKSLGRRVSFAPDPELHTLHIYEKDRGGSPLPRAVVIQEEEERSSREVNLDAVPGDASPMEITGRSATSRRRSFMLTSPPRPADHDAATSSPPNATESNHVALPRANLAALMASPAGSDMQLSSDGSAEAETGALTSPSTHLRAPGSRHFGVSDVTAAVPTLGALLEEDAGEDGHDERGMGHAWDVTKAVPSLDALLEEDVGDSGRDEGVGRTWEVTAAVPSLEALLEDDVKGGGDEEAKGLAESPGDAAHEHPGWEVTAAVPSLGALLEEDVGEEGPERDAREDAMDAYAGDSKHSHASPVAAAALPAGPACDVSASEDIADDAVPATQPEGAADEAGVAGREADTAIATPAPEAAAEHPTPADSPGAPLPTPLTARAPLEPTPSPVSLDAGMGAGQEQPDTPISWFNAAVAPSLDGLDTQSPFAASDSAIAPFHATPSEVQGPRQATMSPDAAVDQALSPAPVQADQDVRDGAGTCMIPEASAGINVPEAVAGVADNQRKDVEDEARVSSPCPTPGDAGAQAKQTPLPPAACPSPGDVEMEVASECVGGASGVVIADGVADEGLPSPAEVADHSSSFAFDAIPTAHAPSPADKATEAAAETPLGSTLLSPHPAAGASPTSAPAPSASSPTSSHGGPGPSHAAPASLSLTPASGLDLTGDDSSDLVRKWGFVPGADDTLALNLRGEAKATLGDATYHQVFGDATSASAFRTSTSTGLPREGQASPRAETEEEQDGMDPLVSSSPMVAEAGDPDRDEMADGRGDVAAGPLGAESGGHDDDDDNLGLGADLVPEAEEGDEVMADDDTFAAPRPRDHRRLTMSLLADDDDGDQLLRETPERRDDGEHEKGPGGAAEAVLGAVTGDASALPSPSPREAWMPAHAATATQALTLSSAPAAGATEALLADTRTADARPDADADAGAETGPSGATTAAPDADSSPALAPFPSPSPALAHPSAATPRPAPQDVALYPAEAPPAATPQLRGRQAPAQAPTPGLSARAVPAPEATPSQQAPRHPASTAQPQPPSSARPPSGPAPAERRLSGALGSARGPAAPAPPTTARGVPLLSPVIVSERPKAGPPAATPVPAVCQLTVADFLKAAEVQFLDHVRRGASIGLGDLAEDPLPSTLPACYALLHLSRPDAEALASAVRTLQEEAAASRVRVGQAEAQLAAENPRLFEEVQRARGAELDRIRASVASLKKVCRAQTMLAWKEWRQRMEEATRQGLLKSAEHLRSDLALLDRALASVSKVAVQVRDAAAAARQQMEAEATQRIAEADRARRAAALQEKLSAQESHNAERAAVLESERARVRALEVQMEEAARRRRRAAAELEQGAGSATSHEDAGARAGEEGSAVRARFQELSLLEGALGMTLETLSHEAEGAWRATVHLGPQGLFRLTLTGRGDGAAPHACAGSVDLAPAASAPGSALPREWLALAARLVAGPDVAPLGGNLLRWTAAGQPWALTEALQRLRPRLASAARLLANLQGLRRRWALLAGVDCRPESGTVSLTFLHHPSQTKVAVEVDATHAAREGQGPCDCRVEVSYSARPPQDVRAVLAEALAKCHDASLGAVCEAVTGALPSL